MAENLAAVRLDDRGGLVFEVVAVAVVDGDEKPGVAAIADDRPTQRVGDRVGVVGVMHRGRGAALLGQPVRPRRVEDDDLVARAADRLDDQRLGRARDVDDRVDMLVAEPVAGDRGGLVGAVVMIGGDHLDRRAQHLAAEILDRHLGRRLAALAGELGIGSAEVEDQAELDDAVRYPAGRGPAAIERGRRRRKAPRRWPGFLPRYDVLRS